MYIVYTIYIILLSNWTLDLRTLESNIALNTHRNIEMLVIGGRVFLDWVIANVLW